MLARFDDSDGLGASCDNCQNIPNPGQADRNDNGTGDACDDPDGDGLFDVADNCPDVANQGQIDSDSGRTSGRARRPMP